MVLQVVAHSGQFVNDRDAVLLQQVARPDARQLQQLRRQQRSAGEQHLAVRSHPPHRAVLRTTQASPWQG